MQSPPVCMRMLLLLWWDSLYPSCLYFFLFFSLLSSFSYRYPSYFPPIWVLLIQLRYESLILFFPIPFLNISLSLTPSPSPYSFLYLVLPFLSIFLPFSFTLLHLPSSSCSTSVSVFTNLSPFSTPSLFLSLSPSLFTHGWIVKGGYLKVQFNH